MTGQSPLVEPDYGKKDFPLTRSYNPRFCSAMSGSKNIALSAGAHDSATRMNGSIRDVLGVNESCPIFVICLERETKARQGMTELMGSLSVPFEFFEAVDGKKLPLHIRDAYDPEGAKSTYGRALLPGELGCYASHLQLITRVAESDFPFALILESDAHPSADTFLLIEDLANRPVDWDLILLHWSTCIPSFRERRRINSKYKLVRFARRTYSAAAYLISPKGAKKILDHALPIVMPIDDLMSGGRVNKGMSTFGAYPLAVSLSSHSKMSSTITNSERLVIEQQRSPRRRNTLAKTVERRTRQLIYQAKRAPQI